MRVEMSRTRGARGVVSLLMLAALAGAGCASSGPPDAAATSRSSLGGPTPTGTTAAGPTPTGKTAAGPTPTGTAAAGAQPLPGSLSPGTWRSEAFQPPFTFTTHFGNWSEVDRGPTFIVLHTHNDQYVLLASPGRVLDQRDPTKADPWPKDYTAWVLAHPGIEAVGTPRPVNVGGVKGTEVEARVVDAPVCPYGFAERCWRLTPSDDPGENYTVDLDEAFRLISLRVNGRPVFIEYDDHHSIDPAFAAAAEEVIHSLDWSQ